MPRSLRSGRDGAVAHTPCFKTHFETFRCERPPRRFALPLLGKEGNVVPKNFVKKQESTALLHRDTKEVLLADAQPPLPGKAGKEGTADHYRAHQIAEESA